MTGKSTNKSNRPRRRKPASDGYAPELDPELQEVVSVSRDRQKKAEQRAEDAQATARAARAEIRLIMKSRSQARNARREIGEAVHLFQLRYPDRVPADDAGALTKPLALAMHVLATSAATAKGRTSNSASVADHIARRLHRLLPLASAADIADAVDFRPYLGTKWPGVHDRSRMLGVTAAECLTIGARHLKPSDVSEREWKNRLARLDYASLSPEEKAERNAEAKAKRAAEKAKRHQGTPAFIAEHVTVLGAKLDRTTVQRWIDKRDGALREKVVERIAQVKDGATAERIADVILGKFNDAKRSASKGMSAVGKKQRRSAATKTASAVSAAAPLGPVVQASAEMVAQASASHAAAAASEGVSAAYKESGQTQVLTQLGSTGGGQASSLPPTSLDTVNVRTTRDEPMTEHNANATEVAAGADALPPLTESASQGATARLHIEVTRGAADLSSEIIAAVNGAYDLEAIKQAVIAHATVALAKAVRAGAAWSTTQSTMTHSEREADMAHFLSVGPVLSAVAGHPAMHGADSLAVTLAAAGHPAEIIRIFLDRLGPTQVPISIDQARRAAERLAAGMSPEEAAVRLERERMGQTGVVGSTRRLTVIRGGRA